MLRHLLWLLGALWIAILPAVPRNVAGEVFTAVCTSCGGDNSSARSALIQLASEHDDLIPLIWQRTDPASPGALERYAGYGGSAANEDPYARFQGTESYLGETDVLDAYTAMYSELAGQDTPVSMQLEFRLADSGHVSLTAHVALSGDLAAANRRILFAVTQHDDSNYSSLVVAFDNTQTFDLTASGQTATYTQMFDFDSNWSIDALRAVVMVQSWDTQEILQAAQTPFTSMVADFNASTTRGPANLGVYFFDNSRPTGAPTTWAWDFDGDGVIDSHEQNPYHLYTTPGTYSVSLTVTNDSDSATAVHTDYINVTGPYDVYGTVNGVWTATQGPYTITDDVTVPFYGTLVIEPGTVIHTAFGKKISVFGKLVADGDGGEPILFSSDSSWKGLKLVNSPDSNLVRNCIFEKATLGALYISSSRALILNNTFRNNASSSMAAAIDVFGTDSVLVAGNLIANNSCVSYSAALSARECSPVFRNNVIVNNTGVSTMVFYNSDNAQCLNNTFANNSVGETEIRVEYSTPTISNCIVRSSNTAITVISGDAPVVSWSNISGNYPGTGNINADPLFAAPSTGAGNTFDGLSADWTLTSASPSVDAGNPDTAWNDTEDPDHPGSPLAPALGTLRNDQGAYGGPTPTLGGAVATDEQVLPPVPTVQLQNYPNPFNPSTTIAFSLPQTGAVELSIYNIRGQRVRTLAQTNVAAGEHSLVWNGTDDSGHTVASGMYFFRLHTPTTTVMHKGMLLK